jgi:hypothetical protein
VELSIDVAQNRVVINGMEAVGHHRWEAATLAVLVRGRHVDAASACAAAALHAALSALGQTRPLNRKQLSRLWSGLDGMFSEVGRADVLANRLGHAMRARTVGPWWWATKPRDKVRVIDAPNLRALRSELPRLAEDDNPESNARLCLQILVHQGAVDDGRIADALAALDATGPWRGASPEFLAYRSLRLAELHMQTRAFDKARHALAACRASFKRHPVAALYLGASAQLLRYRLLYAQSPLRNHAAISAALDPLVNQAASAHAPEVDRYTRGLTLNLAALCERRWLEAHAGSAGSSEAAWRPRHNAALRYWFAALYGFLTSNQYEYVQYMCANIGYFLQRMFERGVVATPDAALDWYGLAQAWHNRFNLPDNNVWEYIYLGDFWLYAPHVRKAFEGRASRGQWAGRRPDTLDFYEFAAQRAQEIGEPRQLAHSLLNLWHFARQHDLIALARPTRATLRKLLTAHPDVRSILRAEGYPMP